MDAAILQRYYKYPAYVFKEIDSTNAFALNIVKKGAAHATLVVADKQTNGRGRMNRKFYSPSGGLYFSLILDFPPEKAGELTTLCAVETAKAIKRMYDIGCSIKWVNDLFADGKKVCGILCEGIPQLNKSVAGIGINIGKNSFPEHINAASLNIDQNKQRKEELCAKICKGILKNIEKIPAHMDTYRSLLMTLNKPISFTYKGKEMYGVALDADDTGALIVKTDEGVLRLFSGEVSVKTV